MEYCASCGKPCGREYESAVQDLWDKRTKYLCKKCAEGQAKTQMFFIKYLVLPIALVIGALKGINFVVCKWIPSLLGSSFAGDTVASIQNGVSWTLSILLALLALKVMLKPWKRLKIIGRIFLLIVVIPVVLIIFVLCFAAGNSRHVPANQPQVESHQIEQTPQVEPNPQVEQTPQIEQTSQVNPN